MITESGINYKDHVSSGSYGYFCGFCGYRLIVEVGGHNDEPSTTIKGKPVMMYCCNEKCSSEHHVRNIDKVEPKGDNK